MATKDEEMKKMSKAFRALFFKRIHYIEKQPRETASTFDLERRPLATEHIDLKRIPAFKLDDFSICSTSLEPGTAYSWSSVQARFEITEIQRVPGEPRQYYPVRAAPINAGPITPRPNVYLVLSSLPWSGYVRIATPATCFQRLLLVQQVVVVDKLQPSHMSFVFLDLATTQAATGLSLSQKASSSKVKPIPYQLGQGEVKHKQFGWFHAIFPGLPSFSAPPVPGLWWIGENVRNSTMVGQSLPFSHDIFYTIGAPCICKLIHTSLEANNAIPQATVDEIEWMVNHTHPSLSPLLLCGTQHVCQVLTYACIGPSLAACFLVQDNPMTREHQLNTPRPLPHWLIIRALSQIAEGLACLHSFHHVHGNLSPENIILDVPNQDFVLIDYTNMNRGLRDLKKASGGLRYGEAFLAPEQELDTKRGGTPADIFSFGLVLFACFHKAQPHPSVEAVRDDIVPTPHSWKEVWTPDIDKLFEDCTKIDPTQRPTASELVSRLSAMFSDQSAINDTWTTADRDF